MDIGFSQFEKALVPPFVPPLALCTNIPTPHADENAFVVPSDYVELRRSLTRDWIGLPRSTFYYRASEAGDLLSDLQVMHLIESIQDELPGHGYRRVTHELRRRGHLINHKRIARLMKMHGLGIKPRRRFVRTTYGDHDSPIFPNLYRNVIPGFPNLVWVADFTHIRIETGFAI